MQQNTHQDWQAIHEQLQRLAKQRAQADAQEGPLLLAAWRSGVHTHMGFGSFYEYIERVFGYSPRFVSERLRVARALQELLLLQEALASGRLSWSAMRELTRVATQDTEASWLDAATGKTVRELEQMVSGLEPGAKPGDTAAPQVKRHTLRLEISGETLAAYREAVAKLQRTTAGGLDEDAALLLMARQVLEGPADAGTAGYQIAISVCEHCEQGVQHGRGEAVPVAPEVVEMATCDAQVLPKSQAEKPSKQRATQTIPPATRRQVMRRDGGRCKVDGCRHATFVDVHHLRPRSEGGTHDPEILLVLCGAHHRATHAGALLIEGGASTGFRFYHADGSVYGKPLLPADAAANRDAFLALRGLGFPETAVKSALATLRAHGHLSNADTGAWVRAALQKLTAATCLPAYSAAHVRQPTVGYAAFPTRGLAA